jgi:tetratricopeptide (TPR) repeat protein
METLQGKRGEAPGKSSAPASNSGHPAVRARTIGIRGIFLVFVTLVLLATACSSRATRPLDPEAAALVEALRSAYRHSDFQAALALADSLDLRAPGLAEVEYTRGLTLNAMRRYDEARASLQRVVERDPRYRGAWYHLGHNAFLQRQYTDAIRHYGKERELVARLLKSRRDESIDPQALPTIIAQIGRAYERLGVPDSARIAYEQALSLDSTLAVGHAWMGEWCENHGLLEEAFHHARKALKGDARNLEYVYRLGLMYLQNGHPAESLPFLGLVAQQWPGHEGATYNLGRALKATGSEEEGQALLDRVEEIQRLQEEALVAERGVETYPDDPNRWVALAGYMLRSGYLDRAEVAFQAARALAPDNLLLQNDLANLALARGDTTSAILRFQNLLRQDSTFADGWLNLGIVYAVRGRPDDARVAWEHVLRHRPQDPDARRYLSELDQLGRVPAH